MAIVCASKDPRVKKRRTRAIGQHVGQRKQQRTGDTHCGTTALRSPSTHGRSRTSGHMPAHGKSTEQQRQSATRLCSKSGNIWRSPCVCVWFIATKRHECLGSCRTTCRIGGDERTADTIAPPPLSPPAAAKQPSACSSSVFNHHHHCVHLLLCTVA